jgi:hypothetical protein
MHSSAQCSHLQLETLELGIKLVAVQASSLESFTSDRPDIARKMALIKDHAA